MEQRDFFKTTAAMTAFTMAGTSQFNPNVLANGPMPSTNNRIQTGIFKLRGEDIKVHGIQTGSVAVKKNFRTKKGRGLFSKINILIGQEYTEYLPIWVWVVEHPEGVIVIDTGEIEAAMHAEFYAGVSRESKFNLFALGIRLSVTHTDELGSQLSRLNIGTTKVSKVVLTHLHGDHTDGLRFFKNREIIVNELEYKHPYGSLPSTYPKWFNPTLVNYQKNRVDTFELAFPLTKSEDMFLVSTPGHTRYHSSVLLKTDDVDLLFAGDVTYTSQQLQSFELAGAHQDYALSLKTFQNILTHAAKHPLIYLPTHDEHAADRMVGKITV